MFMFLGFAFVDIKVALSCGNLVILSSFLLQR